jgi:S1-C subfamily serine protease
MIEHSASQSGQWRRRMGHVRTRGGGALLVALGVLAALMALLLYNLLVTGPQPLTPQQVNDTVAQVLASATPPPAFSARVYQAIQPSLVLIQTQSPGENGEEANGLGSGVVINDSGDILTSLHVVADAADIRLTFADGTQSAAQVTATQPENDIAVLSASQLPGLVVPATLGSAGAMRVGDEAFAVGNPFGLYSSMSAGVISGFERSFQPPDSDQRLEGLIQVDAAVNPGNSGGPLLNRSGQVIGIVVGIVNPTEQEVFIGIGFAVPIQVAVGAVGSLPY